MRCERAWLIAFSGLLFPVLQAQDEPLLASDEFHIDEEQIADATLAIVAYDDYNPRIGGEAVRMGANGPCIGWVEDHYPDGVLQHKGYYDDGRLVIYKNYYPDGTLEREFRAIDDLRSVLRTYHTNGTLWTQARYQKRMAVRYEEHYRNGQLRYAEEKHKSGDYYTRMDLFDPNGSPISTLELTDRKHVKFLQTEYHPNGRKRSQGEAMFDPSLHDVRRVGTWTTYDADGHAVREDHYVDGKVHETVDLH